MLLAGADATEIPAEGSIGKGLLDTIKEDGKLVGIVALKLGDGLFATVDG